MVKVIKRGELPQEKVSRFICRNCKSELEAKNSEWEGSVDTREPNVFSISCPVCKHDIYRNGLP